MVLVSWWEIAFFIIWWQTCQAKYIYIRVCVCLVKPVWFSRSRPTMNTWRDRPGIACQQNTHELLHSLANVLSGQDGLQKDETTAWPWAREHSSLCDVHECEFVWIWSHWNAHAVLLAVGMCIRVTANSCVKLDAESCMSGLFPGSGKWNVFIRLWRKMKGRYLDPNIL